MPMILKPRTAASPQAISSNGGAVTFTSEAKVNGAPTSTALLTYILDPGDGFTWSTGLTRQAVTIQLNGAYRPLPAPPLPLTLTPNGQPPKTILIILVEGRLVDAAGNPHGDVSRSKAMVTVGQPLSDLVKTLRTTGSLTQVSLGQRLGVSGSWISDIENGATPSFSLLRDLKRQLSEIEP